MTVMFHILRYLIICVSFLAIYDANSVIKNDDSEISEITSLIMLSCFELMLVGKFISTICRLFFDNQLSTVLTKLETIHEKLIQLNVIEWLISNICPFVALFEYILLILYIKWLVNKINGHILEGYSKISTLRDMYLDVVECLNNANRSIYGLSGTVGLIGTNVVQILKTLYRSLFFPTENLDDVDIITSLIELSIKIINIILLYKIGHITEKEINRMSLVLHKRSVIERNPRIKRQIKFFILRRLHEHYRFEMYGIWQINLRQLLILSNKVCVYLIIQILFKL
ncbi:uncharacterized protein LOC126550513, partial [Aphis gossypii]|uniref:uncharacterized protein LOC126550513 n=1 Tax=Aphis gossypii TaxID=80765 RepID=UPI0021594E02